MTVYNNIKTRYAKAFESLTRFIFSGEVLAMGKVEVQPETLSCSSTSLGLDSWPPRQPSNSDSLLSSSFGGCNTGEPSFVFII
jgi:hypothetical protein